MQNSRKGGRGLELLLGLDKVQHVLTHGVHQFGIEIHRCGMNNHRLLLTLCLSAAAFPVTKQNYANDSKLKEEIEFLDFLPVVG